MPSLVLRPVREVAASGANQRSHEDSRLQRGRRPVPLITLVSDLHPRRSTSRSIAIVAAATVALGLACGGDHSGTLAKVQKRGVIIWGADLQGGEPYLYDDPSNPGHIVGFEVDIMDALARRLGVKQRSAQFNWS